MSVTMQALKLVFGTGNSDEPLPVALGFWPQAPSNSPSATAPASTAIPRTRPKALSSYVTLRPVDEVATGAIRETVPPHPSLAHPRVCLWLPRLRAVRPSHNG